MLSNNYLIYIRLIKWASIVTVIVGLLYIGYAMMINQRQSILPNDQDAILEDSAAKPEVFQEAISLESPELLEQRDIFSSKPIVGTSTDQSAEGELPSNLKVVGILVGHPSQIIVENIMLKETYFINEGETQGGVRLERVYPDKIVINYLNQEMSVPINKSAIVNPVVNNVQIP